MSEKKPKNKCIYSSLLKNFKPQLPSNLRIIFFLLISLLGAALDIYTKSAAFDYISGHFSHTKPVIDNFFNLVARENSGAAWSSFQGQTVFLISISVIALAVLLFIFLTGQVKSRITFIAVSLFGAGILGNLYDRVFNHGRVRDFLDFYITLKGKEYHWPAFNLADSFLCISVGLLIISSFKTTTDERPLQS